MSIQKRKKGQRGKGRKAGEQKVGAEQILQTAIELFAENGFMATSIQAIADKLDVSQSAVMYHFQNKTKLFSGSIEMIQRRNWALVQKSTLPEDGAVLRLQKHFKSNLKWATDAPEEAQIILLLYCLAAYDPEFAALNQNVLSHGRENIRAILLAGQRERVFQFKIDLALAAEMLHDTLLAGILSWVTTRKCLPKGPKDKKGALEHLMKKWEKTFALVTSTPTSN